MAKRLTDTEKWKKSWFRTMDPEYKCFWYFLLDYCDFAGIWEVDFDVAEFYVGKTMDRKKIEDFFTKHVDVIDSGKRWFITDFIVFQYGEKLKVGHAFHQKIIDRLNKAGLIKKYFILKGGYYCFDKDAHNTLFDRVSDTLHDTDKIDGNEKNEKTPLLTLPYRVSHTVLPNQDINKNEDNDTLSDTIVIGDKNKKRKIEEEKEKEEEKEEGENSIKNTFDKFWEIYDKNIARFNCEKLWMHLTQQERLEILDYVPKYVMAQPEKQYRVNPAKFIEEKMWYNEIIQPKLNGKHGTSKPSGSELTAALRKKLGR